MSFTDIVNSPYLTQEDKIKAINDFVEAERLAIDEENRKAMNRIKQGSALQVASGLPILNIPYIGTGLGGAMYEAGNAIMQGKPQNEVLKDTARGFAIGESVGAIPYIGKLASKTKTGQTINEKASNLFNKLKNTEIGQKISKKASNVYDYLMTDIKALNPNKQIAYHGSPYDFNKFNNEKIGTGEGAQIHGLGHYTALNKDIADKRYRERLLNKGNRYKINGEVIKNDDYSYDFNANSIIGDTKHYGGIENYTNKLKNDLKKAHELIEEYDLKYSPKEIMADDELYLNYIAAQDYIERMPQEIEFLNGLKGKKIEENKGQLYKIAIPKDDVMLRENLPFGEQSPKVQRALNEIQQERLKQAGFSSQEEVNKMLDNLYGEYENVVKTPLAPWESSTIFDLQGKISKLERLQPFWEDGYRKNYIYDKLGTPQETTDLLNKHGIKGISYNGGIDGEGRVIFNPNDIDIVRKYYNQPEAIEYFKKLQPNYGAVVNSFDSVPIDKKYWKQYAKDNLVGERVDIPNYTTVSFTRNNLGKDYSYNLPEYPTLFDQLKGSNYAFSTNYKNEKDRIYDHFVNTNDNRLFDYLIEVIKDNEGDYHHNYKMMKNISRGDKP